MQREKMGIVNWNPMGMGISMVGEWEWEWLCGNGREWESERHSRTPLYYRHIDTDVTNFYRSSVVILVYFGGFNKLDMVLHTGK